MGSANVALLAFNRGRLSPEALARTDFKRTALSAEVMTNWMPRSLGSMMLRPGLGDTGATRSNLKSVTIPFIFAVDDTARLEITNGVMRVWVDDALVTRAPVSSVVVNGTFNSDLTGWTDQDEGSAASTWVVGGYLSLVGTTNGAARRRQMVANASPGSRHALNITIVRGPVYLRVGSTAGGDEYVTETQLGTGSHSLAFTPSGDFHIDLFAYNEYAALVDSIAVAPSGVMAVTAPWAEDDLGLLRWASSGDIVYVACAGYQQYMIQRRASDSWSVVLYEANDGPFRVMNLGPVTITPSAAEGDITLTASKALFRASHVGALYRLTQTGQAESVELTGDNQFSDPIRVTGVDASRVFAIVVAGTWSGEITLQYSVGDPGDWVDAPSAAYTANTAVSYDDTLDNQVVYYRIGIKAGDYVSGTATVSLTYSAGSQTGVARVTSYVSPTVVNAVVLDPFGNATASADWSESRWSGYRGWPSAVAFYEGRLWWAGKDRIDGSISDSFYSFDDGFEGDAGPISRSIGSGPVDNINWMLGMQRLILGADGSIWSARSSSFDEPLTPSNFNLKDISGQGSAKVAAVKIDANGAFVQRSGVRLFEVAYDSGSFDYSAGHLEMHVPEMGEPSIVKIVVQYQPEVRLHFIRSNGTVAVQIFEEAEEVNCWIDVESPSAGGFVEDAVVLPGLGEDQVYYTIRRTVGGSTIRRHEKWAMERECVGGTLNKIADSFVVTGAGAVTGLHHLEGQEVVCWADGVDQGVFTVSGGAIPVTASTGAVTGLGYDAQWKSTKLAYAVEAGTALCMKKRLERLGVIAMNMHPRGLRFGPTFDLMDDLPATEQYADVDPNAIWATYDEETFPFPGEWDTDARLCLEASAPRPVKLLAAIVQMETHAS